MQRLGKSPACRSSSSGKIYRRQLVFLSVIRRRQQKLRRGKILQPQLKALES